MNSVLFSDEDAGAKQGPALQSRTRDGLNVRLEVTGAGYRSTGACRGLRWGKPLGNGEIIHPFMEISTRGEVHDIN